MTDNQIVGLAQPFVWLYVRTADDNYTNLVRFPLTGSDFFVSFQDDTVFSAGDADIPGTGQSKTGRSLTKIILIDPAFTYLEGLFVRNRFLSFEYGWISEDGTVLETSGIIRSMVSSLVPKFTYSGTELEVTLVSDLSVANEGNDVGTMLSSTTITSKLFIAKENKGLADTEGAGVDISKLIKDNNLYDKEVEPIKQITKTYTTVGGNTASVTVPSRRREVVPKQGLALGTFLIKQAASVARFERISDIVVYVAALCGMEYDVDETDICPYNIYLVNKTLDAFIRDDLVRLAKDKQGRTDFRYWVRGNVLYFKNAQDIRAIKRLEFIGDNKSLTERFSDPLRKSILLDFTLELVPNLIINGPSVSTKAVGFDPLNKKMTGRHAAVFKSEEVIRDVFNELEELYRQDPSGNNNRSDVYGGNYDLDTISKDGDDISKSSYGASQSDWLVWEASAQLADHYAGGSVFNMFGNGKDVKDRFQLAAYKALLKRRNQGLDNELYTPPEAIAAMQASDAKTIRKQAPKDPTQAGRMYVLPYADSRAADLAEGVLSASMRGPFRAKGTCYGDPAMRLLSGALVLVHTPEGYHYSSGRYLVDGLVHKIDAGGFTTEISLVTDGVSRHSTMDELIRDAEAPSLEDLRVQQAREDDRAGDTVIKTVRRDD